MFQKKISDSEFARVESRISPHLDSAGLFYPPVGWIYLIEELHDSLLQIHPNYRLGQVKEKFGGLRYYIDVNYIDHSDPEYDCKQAEEWELYRQMQDVITHYEKISHTVCQNCGVQGAFTAVTNSHTLTVCISCSQELENVTF